MTHPATAPLPRARGVRVVPVLIVTARLLPLWLAWLVVVVLGRLLCRPAQRIPVVVRLVRRVRARDEPSSRASAAVVIDEVRAHHR